MDDLVRRKDVIDALHGLAHRFEDPEDWCVLEGEAEFVVSKLPSAQPETCAYWDRESNFCALHRPSAQPEWIPCRERCLEKTEA